MKRLFYIVLAAGIPLFSGCQEEDKPTPMDALLFQVVPLEGGHFSGISMGDGMEKVKSLQQGALVVEKEDELLYKVPFKNSDTAYFNVNYQFDQLTGDYGLFEIQIDIRLFDPVQTKALFDRFKHFFDAQYGKSTMASGYTTWSTSTSNDLALYISMMDESEDYGYSLLAITFLEDKATN